MHRRYQVLFCEPVDALITVGHTVPPTTCRARWPGSWNARWAHIATRAPPNALSALAALVRASHQRRGLSAEVLRAMRSLAEERGRHSLVAPVCPILKSSYPLTPFERYVEWKRDDGAPFDPWLRVHQRRGPEFLKIMPKSLVVSGKVSEWEEWTGMSFPGSGPYVVPGALQPVWIDRQRNEGRYEDPNVWMRHPIAGEETA